MPADKGYVTVVIRRSNYNDKIQQLLSDHTTYRKLTKDPTPTHEAKVTRLLKKLEKEREIPPACQKA